MTRSCQYNRDGRCTDCSAAHHTAEAETPRAGFEIADQGATSGHTNRSLYGHSCGAYYSSEKSRVEHAVPITLIALVAPSHSSSVQGLHPFSANLCSTNIVCTLLHIQEGENLNAAEHRSTDDRGNGTLSSAANRLRLRFLSLDHRSGNEFTTEDSLSRLAPAAHCLRDYVGNEMRLRHQCVAFTPNRERTINELLIKINSNRTPDAA
ncbi:hypothetical protein EVAR_93656_1 [Eumeta japonica]|uniref:Uncharacterized protein n=1 Tax=Eumeta variegata TaxID=151549 RepID=A0A4C1TQQ6_EUMVA|nr:hypothetical protein EVAR_93656_1 [Eumeta japonica]